MTQSIILKEAEKILFWAFRVKCSKKDKISEAIKVVILGSHKTYKYILITGLLAKATNEKVNALALQAGAPIAWAFDARSLCHKVVVPFERNFLHNALGASNEPFLNKPARFTHLSDSNAVRKGKDKETLNLLMDIFKSISTADESKSYLACALGFLNEWLEKNNKLEDSTIKYNPTLVEIYEFIVRFLDRSFEGETSIIIVWALEKIYHNKFSKNFKVNVHKVNQSGSSSKEVGDIDIYKEEKFYYAIEVKDKVFNEYDLEHALKKMQSANGKKWQFIYGSKASYIKKKIDKKISSFEQNGFMILFQDIRTYARTIIFKVDIVYKQEFIDAVMSTAIEINCKNETKIWLQKIISELNWK